jgi:hypothetical protein
MGRKIVDATKAWRIRRTRGEIGFLRLRKTTERALPFFALDALAGGVFFCGVYFEVVLEDIPSGSVDFAGVCPPSPAGASDCIARGPESTDCARAEISNSEPKKLAANNTQQNLILNRATFLIIAEIAATAENAAVYLLYSRRG